MSSSRKEAVILAVILFMAVILIYSSVAKFDAFARSSTISTGCTKRDPTKPGATSAKECCWGVTVTDDKSGRITDVYSLCQTCEYDSNGNKIDCRDTSPLRNTGLGNTPPPSVGTEQPPSPTPPLHPVPPPSAGTEQPSTLQTTTCPDGSAPGANSKCPTNTTTNQQLAPTSSPSQHHHKGSNMLGGQESTSKKDNDGGSDKGTQPAP
jgi:hypothetical protein